MPQKKLTSPFDGFGGWHLNGKDAENFLKQIANPKPNPLAVACLKRCKELMKEYDKKGYVTVYAKPKRNLAK